MQFVFLLLLAWCGCVLANFPGSNRFYSGPSTTVGSSNCPIIQCTAATPACAAFEWRDGCAFNSSGTCRACTGVTSGNYFLNAAPALTNACTQAPCPSCTAGNRNNGCSASSPGSCVGCNPSTPPAGNYFIAPPNATFQCAFTTFPIAPSGSRYTNQNSTFMGDLVSCGAIASNLYFTRPVLHTENCVTAAKRICPAGQRNVNSNSTYEGDCVNCANQVNGTHWIPNTAWNDNCPSTPCSNDCPIGQWRSNCAGTSHGSCTACTTANASQVYSTNGGWANTCQVENCVRSCPIGQYIFGCGAHGATFGSLSCANCNNAVVNVNYYRGQGAYTIGSCPTTPCGACPNGNFRSGCGNTSEGICIGCFNTV